MISVPTGQTNILEILERVDEAAARQGVSVETWLLHHLQADVQAQRLSDQEEDEKVILDLVVRHFRSLELDINDQASLAKALVRTIEQGSPEDLGLGQAHRRYRFRRRANKLSIRVGEGQVSLSLPYAMRLASMLDQEGQYNDFADEAA